MWRGVRLKAGKLVRILFFFFFGHFFSFLKNYLFTYFWLRWVFIAARGLSLVAASGGYSSLRCTGFSLQWLLLLRSTDCRHTGFSNRGTWAQQWCSRALQCRLSSCGARAQLLRSMWDLPGPGIEPVSPVLAGGFLTTALPGKSPDLSLSLVSSTYQFGQVTLPL